MNISGKKSHQPQSRPLVARLLLLLFLSAACFRVGALDFGVDPSHLGKGDWIYILSNDTSEYGGSVASLMAYEKSQGMNFLIVKAGESNVFFPNNSSPQFTASLVTAAHNAGLKIFGYTRSYGRDIPGELNVITNILNLGCDGYIVDAESEWESASLPNNTTKAVQLLQPIKAMFPTRFLAHSPFLYISYHSTFPYLQFGVYCDAVMPQNYWKNFGITPAQCVTDMDTQWNWWQSSLTGTNRTAIKPICPIAQGWTPGPNLVTTGAEIVQFNYACTNDANPASVGGYNGVSYFRCELHSADMWSGIASVNYPSTQPRLNQFKVLAGEQFQINLSGTLGTSYIVEGSSNLVNWIPITTNVNTNGVVVFTNSVANDRTGFYRLKLGQ